MNEPDSKIVDKIKSRIFALDFDGGIRQFLECLEKDPTVKGLYSMRHFIGPHLYCKKVDFDRVYENCYRALHINPKNGGAWAFLGTVYKSQKKYKQALDCFLKAFVFETILPNLVDLAFVYRNLGMFDESTKIIFCKELFMRYFVKKERMLVKYQTVNQWQLSMALTFIDLKKPTEEIVKEIEKKGLKLLLLYFILDERDLHGDTGRKLVELFDLLEGKGIAFRVVHPLPICIFGVDYKKIFSRYKIPTSCTQCSYSCVIKKSSFVELCSKKKFDNELVLKNLQNNLEKRHVTKITPQTCLNCQYYSSGMCIGLCKQVKVTPE